MFLFRKNAHQIEQKELMEIDTVLWFNIAAAPVFLHQGKDWRIFGGYWAGNKEKISQDYERLQSQYSAVCKQDVLEKLDELMQQGEHFAYQQEMEQIQQQLQMQRLSLDRYLSQIHQTRESFTAAVHTAAEKNTRARMALLQIAQNENLVPTEEDIDKTLSERAERTKKTLEEVKAASNVEAIRRNEGIRRAADYVIEHSTIEEK